MAFVELQPVLLICCAAALVWYLRAVRRLAGAQPDSAWRRSRTVAFVVGLVLTLVVTDGAVTTHTERLFWCWLTQALLLLLILPIPILMGQPIQLARLAGGKTEKPPLLTRFADSSFGSLCASPVCGAAIIPVACVVFLFGPIPGWSIQHLAVGWIIQVAMLVTGLLIVMPLVSTDSASTSVSSMAIGAAVAISFVELLIDAVPGIVMRLSTHPVTNFFDFRVAAGQLSPLHDQQIAGGILWCVAELLDLPFLLLIFRRWIQADAREAAVIDAAIFDDQLAAIATPRSATEQAPELDQPWFLSDPQLRDRFRR